MQYRGGGLKLFQLKTVWCIVWVRKWYHLIALHSENILSTWFDVIQHLKNFLQLPEVWKVIKNQHFLWFQSPIFTFEGSIKTKKLPSAYVFVNKNCVRCRTIMLFVSASTHSHEEVFTNLLWHCHCSRRFFTEPKVISCHSQNSNFLHHFEPFWLQKWFERVWNSKKHHLLTFL